MNKNSPDRSEPVVVLETDDPVAIGLAKESLKDSGIPFFVRDEIGTLIEGVDPFLRKRVQVLVARDREAQARELLMPLLNPKPDGQSPAES